MSTRYRIVTLDRDRYGVEKCHTEIVRWTGKRQDKWWRCSDTELIGTRPYQYLQDVSLDFKTEKEAEQWIKKEIDYNASAEAKQRQHQAFIDANPPREVPPYRWLDR